MLTAETYSYILILGSFCQGWLPFFNRSWSSWPEHFVQHYRSPFLLSICLCQTDISKDDLGGCTFAVYRVIWKEIIPSKMEVSTAMMSYDFKMSPDYNYDVLKL